MSEISADPDLLRETVEDFLASAERCYRLARAALDHRARDRLLDLARDFEERAARAQAPGNPARMGSSQNPRRPAALAPSWTATSTFEIAQGTTLTAPGEKYPSPALIVLFGAAGAVLPIVLLFLVRFETPDLFGFTVLAWPTSILIADVQQPPGPVTGRAFLLPFLGNVAIYLVFGSLLWLGLIPPRSTVYLTIIALMYLTIIGVAGSCRLLLG